MNIIVSILLIPVLLFALYWPVLPVIIDTIKDLRGS